MWVLAGVGLHLSACTADTTTAGLSPEELGPDANIASANAALASGTLRLNDVYFVPDRDNASDAPMYQTATGTSVVRRIPEHAAVKVVMAESSGGRYRVDHAGTLGWMLQSDLALQYHYDGTLSLSRINALARARAVMGMSYWWSNARWPATGPTTWPVNNTGECSGVCGGAVPCTHAAIGGGPEYGSDCAGLVSTLWGFPDADPDTNPVNNGFATKTYSVDTVNWTTVPLADALPGDAIVKHTDTTKHVFFAATKRDGRDAFRTFECAGCSRGCVTGLRVIRDTDGWHAIRRTGW